MLAPNSQQIEWVLYRAHQFHGHWRESRPSFDSAALGDSEEGVARAAGFEKAGQFSYTTELRHHLDDRGPSDVPT